MQIDHPLLSRRPGPKIPRLSLDRAAEVSFRLIRLHEVCGPARQALALMLADRTLTQADTGAPIYWITLVRQKEELHMEGLPPFCDPSRLVFVKLEKPDDALWALEEVLRSGAVPLAVAELPEPPGLTQVRRLHLAAETGAAAHGERPMGLILTPGDGGAPGIETRWHMSSDHASPAEGGERWQLDRRRARMEPPRSWTLQIGREGPELGPYPPVKQPPSQKGATAPAPDSPAAGLPDTRGQDAGGAENRHPMSPTGGTAGQERPKTGVCD